MSDAETTSTASAHRGGVPRSLSQTIRRLASWTIVAGFVVVVGLVTYDRRDELQALVDAPGPTLVGLGGLILAGHFLNSTEFWVLYRAQRLSIGVGETWLLFLANQFANLAPGQLGTAYRFRYLKVVHGFDYAKSTSNFGANLAITVASSALVGVAGLSWSLLDGRRPSLWLFVAIAVLAVLAVALVLFELPSIDAAHGRAAHAWNRFVDGWESVRRHHGAISAVLCLDVAKYLLVALRFDLAFGLLGVDQPYAYFLVVAPAAGLAGALAFTPGGLGIREGFITAAALGMGSSLDTSLLAATVDRGMMLAVSLVAGSFGMWWTTRRLQASSRSEPPLRGPPPRDPQCSDSADTSDSTTA